MSEITEIEENISSMYEALEDTLNEIHNTVKFRTAVPVEDVFVNTKKIVYTLVI